MTPVDEPEVGDEYGPVTDLVFSLFAVAVLLMAVIATTGSLERRALSDRLETSADAVARLEADRARLEQEAARLSGERAAGRTRSVELVSPPTAGRAADDGRLRAERDLARREAERLTDALAGARATAEAARQAEADAEARAERLDRERGAAIAEAAELARQRADADRALVAAGEELAVLRRATYRRLELRTLHPADPAGFLADGGLDLLLAEILLALGEHRQALVDIEANRIGIEIDEPASLGDGTAATDPDFARSAAVATAVVTALRRTPLPMSCIAVLPFGKNRAGSVAAIAAGPDAGRRLDQFDRLGAGGALSEIGKALRDSRSADRRIVLVAETIATSPCLHDDLIAGIDAWILAGGVE